MEYQAISGSHSLRGLATSVFVGQISKNCISLSVYSTVNIFFYINLKVTWERKIYLCFSNNPLATHWYIVILIISLNARTLGSSSSNTSAFSIALKKNVVNDSREY
jgi:hypothetical protein